MTKQIPLTQGKFAVVDDDDFEWLSKRKWHIGANGYAFADGGKIRMHRLITKCPNDMEVDHINHDRLDNRKINLRVCTRVENCRNRGMNKNNKSGYKGVSFHKPLGKWKAKIVLSNKHFHLGYFDTPESASEAYELAARNNGFLR